MFKKSNLKKLIIILFIINVFYIVMFNGFLIRETCLVRQNGSFYCLTQSFDGYILTKISGTIIPIETNHEFISSPDYINNLKENSINLSLIYRLIELIQIVVIIVLIVDYKTFKES